MNFLRRFLVSALAIIITSYLLPGIHLDMSLMAIIIVTAVLGLLNSIVKPILVFLTIPITIITLGLFLLVINGIIIMIADSLLDGFKVDGFFWALIFSFIVSIIVSFFGKVNNSRRR